MPPLVLEIRVDDKGSPVLRQFQAEIQQTGQGAQQGFSQATKASEGFSTSLLGVVKQGAGLALGFAGIQSIGSMLLSAASNAAAFEAAMANVNTLGITSTATQQLLREQLLQLPPVLGSSTELAKGLYEVLSSGVEPAKAVAFLEQSALLAKAGLAQLDTATIALTKTMAAYRLPTEDAAKVSDILFKAVEVGQGSLQQFAGAMPQVTQLSASMGVSFADTANGMATLTQTFRNADTAATGFRSMLQQLIQNNEKFLALGINIKQVISEQGLIGAVKVLQQVSQGSSERLRVFINDIEGFNAALALTGPQFTTLVQNQQKFANATGSVANAVKEQTKTATAAWEGFTTSVGKLVQDISPPILAAFTTITTGAGSFVESIRTAIRGVPEEVKAAKIELDKLAPDFADTIRKLLAVPADKGPFLKTTQDYHAELLRLRDAQQGATENQNLWNTAIARADIELTKALKPYTEWRDESLRAAEATKANELAIKNTNTAIAQLDASLKALKPGDLPRVIAAGELQLQLGAAEKAMRSLIGAFHNGLIPLEELKTAGDTTAKILTDRFGEVPDSMKRILIEIRALTDTTAEVETAAITSFRKITAVRDEETGKILKIVQNENAAIVKLYDESGKLAGGAMQRGVEDVRGTIVKSTEETGKQAAGGFTKGLTSVSLDPAKQALLDTFTQVFNAVDQWKRGLIALDPATAQAAAGFGILSGSAAEAATSIDQSAQKAKDAKQTFEFWGNEVETVESKAKSLSKVQLAPIFTPWADDLPGVRTQIQALTTDMAGLINNSLGLGSAFGTTYTYEQYVTDQTTELRKGIEILRQKEFELENQTWDLATAQQHLGDSAAFAYATLGIQSGEELRAEVQREIAAFGQLRESQERLRDIWVDRILPDIIEAYGETSAEAQAAMQRYADAVIGQAAQTLGTIEQIAIQTVQHVDASVSASVSASMSGMIQRTTEHQIAQLQLLQAQQDLRLLPEEQMLSALQRQSGLLASQLQISEDMLAVRGDTAATDRTLLTLQVERSRAEYALLQVVFDRNDAEVRHLATLERQSGALAQQLQLSQNMLAAQGLTPATNETLLALQVERDRLELARLGLEETDSRVQALEEQIRHLDHQIQQEQARLRLAADQNTLANVGLELARAQLIVEQDERQIMLDLARDQQIAAAELSASLEDHIAALDRQIAQEQARLQLIADQNALNNFGFVMTQAQFTLDADRQQLALDMQRDRMAGERDYLTLLEQELAITQQIEESRQASAASTATVAGQMMTTATSATDAIGTLVSASVDTLGIVTGQAWTTLEQFADGIMLRTGNVANTSMEALDRLNQRTADSLRGSQALLAAYQGLFIPPSASTTPLLPLVGMPRQHGGPVVAGQTYLVGEVGPEPFFGLGGQRGLVGTQGPSLWSPPVSGMIFPASQPGSSAPAAAPAQAQNVQHITNTNHFTFTFTMPPGVQRMGRTEQQEFVTMITSAINEAIARKQIRL